MPAVADRVVAAVRYRFRVDVFGRNHWSAENKFVVKILGFEHLGRDRIEKSFRTFRLLVVHQTFNVMAFHFMPKRLVIRMHLRVGRQCLYGFGDALIVVLDTVGDQFLDVWPVAFFKRDFRGARAFAKTCVVAVKAVQYFFR